MALRSLLCLLAVVWIATGSVLPSTGGHVLSKRAAWLYKQGAYTLAFANQDPPKVILLRSLLDNLYANIQPVIQELQSRGTSVAFDTFFKHRANKKFVTTLFNNVAAGAPVYAPTDPPQPWQAYSPTGSPIFLVIQQLGQWEGIINGNLEDAFTWCGKNPFLTAAVAVSKDEWPIILICPFFFTAKPPDIYGDIPPASVDKKPASNCLKVHAITNNFRKASPRTVKQPTGFTLTQYRSWILLEELAHLYYQAAKGIQGLDVYNVNRARKLNPQDALRNGPSYSYYAAAVSGNCVEFPAKTQRGDMLLEVDEAVVDPEEYADYTDDNPWYEYAISIEASDIQLDPNIVAGE